MTDILTYLQAVNKMASRLNAPTIEGIVLAHGKSFTPPLTPRPKGIRKGPDRECYRNAYQLAIENGWTYVEGFAAFSTEIPIPLQHAWVVDNRGALIETTWRESGVAYYGIPLDIPFIHQVILETRRYGVLDPVSRVFRSRYY